MARRSSGGLAFTLEVLAAVLLSGWPRVLFECLAAGTFRVGNALSWLGSLREWSFAVFLFQISDLRSQISGLRFQISDLRSQISDLTSQISNQVRRRQSRFCFRWLAISSLLD